MAKWFVSTLGAVRIRQAFAAVTTRVNFERIHIVEIKNNRPQLGGFVGKSTFYSYIIVTKKRDVFWNRLDTDQINLWKEKPRVSVNRDGSYRVTIGSGNYRRQLTTKQLKYHHRIRDLEPEW
jgi:hypothetical protein